MKKRIGTIDARPAPGVLFKEALEQLEEAIIDECVLGERHPSVAAPSAQPLRDAMDRVKRKRQTVIDYVIALETRS